MLEFWLILIACSAVDDFLLTKIQRAGYDLLPDWNPYNAAFPTDMTEFRCPGESHPITRELHLARLASGYGACGDCRHRSESGTLPQTLVERLEVLHSWRNSISIECHHPAPQSELGARLLQRCPYGIRGIYHNELTRTIICRLVENVLACASDCGTRAMNPLRVLVGYDWRPSSPDLAIAVVETLKRNGCDIVDVGRVSRPCFDLGVSRLGADLGIFVTGGREDESVNGLDVIDRDGNEWSCSQQLGRVVDLLEQPVGRYSRVAGDYQLIPIAKHYEREVLAQYQIGGVLRLLIACGDQFAMQVIGSAILKNGCDAEFVDIDFFRSSREKAADRFREAVRNAHVDAGIVILPDAQTLIAYDERGRQFDFQNLIRWACDAANPGSDQTAELPTPVVIDETGRLCFPGRIPRIDAARTLATLIQFINQSDRPLSAYRAESFNGVG